MICLISALRFHELTKWQQRWNKRGLAGLYEGRHTGRPNKWTYEQRKALAELAQAEGGTAVALLRQIEQRQEHPAISEDTAVRYLKEMNFSYKRYRYSLKKRNQTVFEHAAKV